MLGTSLSVESAAVEERPVCSDHRERGQPCSQWRTVQAREHHTALIHPPPFPTQPQNIARRVWIERNSRKNKMDQWQLLQLQKEIDFSNALFHY